MLRDKSQEQADLSLSPSFLRSLSGPKASEVHLRCRPRAVDLGSVAQQTRSVYRQLTEALALEGGSLEHVVRETVFFRSIAKDMPEYVKARDRVFLEMGQPHSYAPAPVHIQQRPLDAVHLDPSALAGDSVAGAPREGTPSVEILVSAVIPHASTSTVTWRRQVTSPCSCASCATCAELSARYLLLGGQKHVFSGNIYGVSGSAYDETLSMFELAEDLLKQEAMRFPSVARTWIYLRDMDRDYAEFNRARRDFFQRSGVTLLPASTGIDGIPLPGDHNFVLGFYAVDGAQPLSREIMTTPSLNEAHEYGSAFSRGMRVVDANKVALYISGTASVDEVGDTVHVEDFEAQVDRMLRNVSLLLERQGATFDDMVSAMTYIKRAPDAPTFRRILRDRGIRGFPNVIVEAGVCRPDLLCEIEGIAVLPLDV